MSALAGDGRTEEHHRRELAQGCDEAFAGLLVQVFDDLEA
jgi:hypothetical protein